MGVRASADWLNCLNKIDKKDSKIDLEMSVIVVPLHNCLAIIMIVFLLLYIIIMINNL